MTKNYYCVYQSYDIEGKSPMVIFGIGKSIREAQNDALDYVDDENLNGLFTKKCSEKLYNAFAKNLYHSEKYTINVRGLVDFDENNTLYAHNHKVPLKLNIEKMF